MEGVDTCTCLRWASGNATSLVLRSKGRHRQDIQSAHGDEAQQWQGGQKRPWVLVISPAASPAQQAPNPEAAALRTTQQSRYPSPRSCRRSPPATPAQCPPVERTAQGVDLDHNGHRGARAVGAGNLVGAPLLGRAGKRPSPPITAPQASLGSTRLGPHLRVCPGPPISDRSSSCSSIQTVTAVCCPLWG